MDSTGTSRTHLSRHDLGIKQFAQLIAMTIGIRLNGTTWQSERAKDLIKLESFLWLLENQMKCLSCGSERIVFDRSLGGRMACGKCGSTRIGVKRNRFRAFMPSLGNLSPAKNISMSRKDRNFFKKLLKPAGLLILLVFGAPLLLEGTLNGCHSLEKKVISLLSKEDLLSQYAGYGMLAAQYS